MLKWLGTSCWANFLIMSLLWEIISTRLSQLTNVLTVNNMAWFVVCKVQHDSVNMHALLLSESTTSSLLPIGGAVVARSTASLLLRRDLCNFFAHCQGPNHVASAASIEARGWLLCWVWFSCRKDGYPPWPMCVKRLTPANSWACLTVSILRASIVCQWVAWYVL
jgi:hypothetical protein